MQDSNSTSYICGTSSQSSLSNDLQCIEGPSGGLWYDKRTTKLHVEFPKSMESCDMRDSNSTSYICLISVCQSKWPLWWFPVCWMVHPAACDMMRGPPSFLESILHMKSCDMRDVNETSFIFVTSVHQTKRPLRWSLVHWLDQLAICDMQDSDSTSNIFVTSVHQSKRPLRWSPVHWMDHSAVCDTMRGLLSFLWSILYH